MGETGSRSVGQGHAMAPHSSILAWKIPWTEEPGRLQSMGSLRVGHDSVTSFSLFTFMHWRRKWQPTPLFFALRCGVSFFGGIQHSLVNGCSAVSCNFGVLAADKNMSFYLAILCVACP